MPVCNGFIHKVMDSKKNLSYYFGRKLWHKSKKLDNSLLYIDLYLSWIWKSERQVCVLANFFSPWNEGKDLLQLITNSLLPGVHTGWNGEVLWEEAGIYLSEIVSAWVLVTLENLVIWKSGNDHHHFTQSFSPCLGIERHIAPFCRDQTVLMNDRITVMVFMSNKHIVKYLNTRKSRKTHWILESILENVK